MPRSANMCGDIKVFDGGFSCWRIFGAVITETATTQRQNNDDVYNRELYHSVGAEFSFTSSCENTWYVFEF